jgi:hypothetical protein
MIFSITLGFTIFSITRSTGFSITFSTTLGFSTTRSTTRSTGLMRFPGTAGGIHNMGRDARETEEVRSGVL